MNQVIDHVRTLRRNLRALERQVELSLAEQTDCCGVTPAQCHVLLEIEDRGEASVGDLADALELDASTLSRTVDGLVRAGLLKRREDPANRRRALVSLSDAGSTKVAGINELCDGFYSAMLASLPDGDRRALLDFLPRFVDAMRACRLAGSACGRDKAGKGCCS